MTRLLSEHQRERDAWAQMRRSFARQGRPTLTRSTAAIRLALGAWLLGVSCGALIALLLLSQ